MNENRFMFYISKNFQEIKENFKRQITALGFLFDEDVFSDTIIKCNDKINKNFPNIMDEEMINYFWQAFKINTMRELKYLRNKTTDEFPLLYEEEEVTNDKFDAVSDLIIKQFGKNIYKLFLLHANGTPYSELVKMTNINNLKYQFRCVREYVREHYKEN